MCRWRAKLKQLDLLNEFRELISQFRHEAEAASSMQLYDNHKVAENVVLDLFKELYGWKNLRNLNSEKANYPGIDLADDVEKIGIQVSATANIEKVKGALETCSKSNLFNKYERIIIYVVTQKQNSYSQQAIDKITDGKLSFSVSTDILDYDDLCKRAVDSKPAVLQEVINILKAYLRGVDIGLADEDIDPPSNPPEIGLLNLMEIYFPSTLYIAEIKPEIKRIHTKNKKDDMRGAIRQFCQDIGRTIPSGYVVHAGNLVSFFNLENDNPFDSVIDRGNIESLSSFDFYGIDDDHERVFKSLLRFTLQQRLFKERVLWYQDEELFVFLPRHEDGDAREESWVDKKASKRKVFARQYNKNNSSKVFAQKHFAFGVDFLRVENCWYQAITPDWFFSHGDAFKRSGFAEDNLKWLKRQETNRSVYNHFRFVVSWLKSIDQNDLFSVNVKNERFLSFGDSIGLKGLPHLNEDIWKPLPSPEIELDIPERGRLFG